MHVYFHVVYGPVRPEDRPVFFSALPRHFDDSSVHIVLGDLNMTIDPAMNQATPSSNFHDSGRAEIFDWMISLGLIDFWRVENPDVRCFTSPASKNRIDYCLASVNFYDTYIRSSSHLIGSRFGGSDHVPVDFSASSADTPTTESLPFKCPPWLLQDEIVQDYLRHSLTLLADSLDPSRNPGCLLDEHKRRDRIYLRQEYLRRKGATGAQLRLLLAASRECAQSFALDPSDSNLLRRDHSRQAYLNFLTALRERNSVSKFDMDITMGEQSSKQFFRAPAATDLRLKITSVDTPSGLSRDPATILSTHRQYWATFFTQMLMILPSNLSTSTLPNFKVSFNIAFGGFIRLNLPCSTRR
ncbi:unnamed protein product [Peronospora effusa]|nr:unnamed protein product [Peronospora effusa]